MINKGEVVSAALLKLGKNNDYNDNSSSIYILALKLLSDIYDSVAYDTSFLFNAYTVKLTKYNTNVLEENVFNKPVDCLNIIRANTSYRLENEFIISSEDEIIIQYCKKIDDIPDNLFQYIVLRLTVELCLSVPADNDKYTLFSSLCSNERGKILAQQNYNFEWGGNYEL